MTDLLRKVNLHILNPLILLGFAIALVYFLWGIMRFMFNAGSDEERNIGKKNILWGIIGMVIMVSVYGIINVILGTFGLPPPKL